MAGPFKGADIKGLDQVSADLKAFLVEAKKSPVILSDAGDTAVKYIRGSVRARRDGYAPGPLKPRTQALRDALSKYNQTADTYSAKRSNLTFTGELLNNMIYRVESSKIVIYFKGTHSRLVGKNGKPIGEAKTNSEIAAKLNSDPNFHFLFVSKKLNTMLKNRIIAGFRRQLSTYRKLKTLLR